MSPTCRGLSILCPLADEDGHCSHTDSYIPCPVCHDSLAVMGEIRCPADAIFRHLRSMRGGKFDGRGYMHYKWVFGSRCPACSALLATWDETVAHVLETKDDETHRMILMMADAGIV